MSQDSSELDAEIVGINVTPLVDVVLVLLVVLMVTAGYIAARAIPLDLPKAASGQPASTPLVLSIDASGKLFLGSEPVDDRELRLHLRQALRADPNLRAVIAADGAARHRAVVHAIDVLRQEHVSDFAFDVSPEDLRGKP